MSNIAARFASPGLYRLLLAFAVFFHHATRINVGPAAVYVFFVLSGFWISKMWTHRYSNTSAPYFTYLTSRVWRLLPMFMMASAIAWGILLFQHAIPPIPDGFLHQLISNCFIIGYNGLEFTANSPAWSLDIEIQFYVIAPALIFLMARRLPILAASIALSFGASLIHADTTIAPYLVFFAMGVAAAQADWQPGLRLAWGALAATAVLLAACLLSPYRDIILGGLQTGPMHMWNKAGCTVLTVAILPWTIYTARQKGSAADAVSGDLSYIFYLLHWPVLGVINSGGGTSVHHLVEISEAFIVTSVGALLLWRFFDHPINRLRANWVDGRLITRSEASSVITA